MNLKIKKKDNVGTDGGGGVGDESIEGGGLTSLLFSIEGGGLTSLLFHHRPSSPMMCCHWITSVATNEALNPRFERVYDSVFVNILIEVIVGRDIFGGEIFKGMVTSIKEYGAFVELNGGHQGLLHSSELSHDTLCWF